MELSFEALMEPDRRFRILPPHLQYGLHRKQPNIWCIDPALAVSWKKLPHCMAWGANPACKKELEGRRLRYCSKDCAEWWTENHDWTTARGRALELSRFTCAHCGVSDGEPHLQKKAVAVAIKVSLERLEAMERIFGKVGAAGQIDHWEHIVVELRQTWRQRSPYAEREWLWASREMLTLADRLIEEDRTESLGLELRQLVQDAGRHLDDFVVHFEVNHRVPLNGSYRAKTCLNHQANLEVLCVDCHKVVTKAQRRRT